MTGQGCNMPFPLDFHLAVFAEINALSGLYGSQGFLASARTDSRLAGGWRGQGHPRRTAVSRPGALYAVDVQTRVDGLVAKRNLDPSFRRSRISTLPLPAEDQFDVAIRKSKQANRLIRHWCAAAQLA